MYKNNMDGVSVTNYLFDLPPQETVTGLRLLECEVGLSEVVVRKRRLQGNYFASDVTMLACVELSRWEEEEAGKLAVMQASKLLLLLLWLWWSTAFLTYALLQHTHDARNPCYLADKTTK
jgi:hypothetical protein